MGVGGPKDFVAIVNRFPLHDQWVTNMSNGRFVAKSIGKTNWLLPARPFQPAARCRIRHDLASSKQRWRLAIAGRLKQGQTNFLNAEPSATAALSTNG
jgi:hypothetical protein